MSFFYSISAKDLVECKNAVFKERGIPAILRNGFCKSPFSTAWFGKDGHGGYTYDFCRISSGSHLEILFVYVNKGDRWIQIHLNIFKLHPEVEVEAVAQLEGLDGLRFNLPPGRASLMRIYSRHHKIGFFITQKGLTRRLDRVGRSIENDINNIDNFVFKWRGKFTPLLTDWQGRVVQGYE